MSKVVASFNMFRITAINPVNLTQFYAVVCCPCLLLINMFCEVVVTRICYQCFLKFLILKVVMSVAQLYHHLAPRSEVNVVAKALIRLLHNHRWICVWHTNCQNVGFNYGVFRYFREVQSVVLSNIATMSTKRKVCILNEYQVVIFKFR